jgi:hypothetical protein
MSENVGASTSRNPKGLHGLYREDFTLFYFLYIRKVESHVQITDRCAPWKISSGAENLVLQALQL